MERRRARSMLLNNVSGTRQLSGNGVAWSASISPSYLYLSSGGSERVFNSRVHVHVLIVWSFFFFFFRFVPKYFEKDIQSGVPTLTQAGRAALEDELKYEDEDAHADADARERHDNGGSAPSSGS